MRGGGRSVPGVATALAAAGLGLTASVALEAQERPGDREAIQRLRDKDARAVESGDLETLLDVTTEDVVLMPPGADFLRGSAERAAGLETAAAVYETAAEIEYDFEFEELEILGDRAIEWGVLRYRVGSKDGAVQTARFKLLRVLKRLDSGEWRGHRAIWNDFGGAP